jgi:hypothetical protein
MRRQLRAQGLREIILRFANDIVANADLKRSCTNSSLLTRDVECCSSRSHNFSCPVGLSVQRWVKGRIVGSILFEAKDLYGCVGLAGL